jgi:hypothetical protein
MYMWTDDPMSDCGGFIGSTDMRANEEAFTMVLKSCLAEVGNTADGVSDVKSSIKDCIPVVCKSQGCHPRRRLHQDLVQGSYILFSATVQLREGLEMKIIPELERFAKSGVMTNLALTYGANRWVSWLEGETKRSLQSDHSLMYR